jgi:hypothetical protein
LNNGNKVLITDERIRLSRIVELEQKASFIKRLRLIRNEILSNCAYHTKNIEEQTKKMEHLQVPKEELDLICRSHEMSLKLGNELMKEYDSFIKDLENNKL